MLFSLTTKSLARFRRRSTLAKFFNPFQTLELPVELWDEILALLTNDDLLQTACVSRAWNALSLTIYMCRHNVISDTGSIDVPSFFLQALHLACVSPQITALRCTFPAFAVLRRMRSLPGAVANCPHLTSLSVEWRYDPLETLKKSHARAEIVAIIRNVVRTLADRTPGPLIVVGSTKIQRFERKEIPARYLLIGQQRDGVGASVLGRVTHAESESSFSFNRLDWVNVRSIRNGGAGSLECFTLVTFPTASLGLHPTKLLTAADISAILPHLNLPALQSLAIRTDEIDGDVLADFQKRHPHIMS